jgi:hypothetical protein
MLYSQTWTATFTDFCGNAAVPVSITYNWKVDLVAPQLTCPSNIVYACGAPQLVVVPTTAWDNCSGDVPVTATRSDGLAITDPYPVGVTTIYLTAKDECGNSAQCDFTVTVDPCVLNCQTAYGYNPAAGSANCFLNDGFTQWGWTNKITGSVTLDLYAGAAQCLISKGKKAGTVAITYVSGGSVKLVYNLLPGFTMTEAHVYVGYAKYPTINGKATVAPGQYPYSATGLSLTGPAALTVNYPGTFTGTIYVIAHAVTCTAEKSAVIDISANVNSNLETNQLKAYPNPFNERLTFEFVSAKDTHAVLEITNILSQNITPLMVSKVKMGVLNRIEYQPENVVPGILIYRLILDGKVQNGRIVYQK